MIRSLLNGSLVFRPAPPGDADAQGEPVLKLPVAMVRVDLADGEWDRLLGELAVGALTEQEVQAALRVAQVESNIGDRLHGSVKAQPSVGWDDDLAREHALDRMALVAIRIVDRAQVALLDIEPLTEVSFELSEEARAALALGWESMSKRGQFPLPPQGHRRFLQKSKIPIGSLHFVSASDLDAGYFYTMGVALSPEAQAVRSMDVGYGLDGELIVPGQAVSPIPPFLAMATRLMAASIPVSSNISEEEQSIPMRNFPHPTSIDDLEPKRGGLLRPPVRPADTDEASTDLRQQLWRHDHQPQRSSRWAGMPDVGAVFEVTGYNGREIVRLLRRILTDPVLSARRASLALYLNIESAVIDRVGTINAAVDAASELGLRYVAVADDVEDSWLPGLLEYLGADELDDVADHADGRHVVVTDGRPVDPLYTAATAAQRIQSVYSALSVDILKMGMWLCLDAMTARNVWREIRANPHIPSRMLLMPIGIVEPWNAFADNRRDDRTQRPILDPFQKIKFMIEEAQELQMPSLLTDTRHKAKWVLLGRKRDLDVPHLREKFVMGAPGEILGRTADSALPLLTWDEFMECERLARGAGILLGQAGSIEAEQAFRIIGEVTYDAAVVGRNPATAIWTAETERVLRTKKGEGGGDLQAQRSSDVSPFLAVVNRGNESHARLDAWLRYLGTKGHDTDALRRDLSARRERLRELLEQVMGSQGSDPTRYQRLWDEYREAYATYHALIRDNFVATRQRVVAAWSET